jgi:O-Antigen ligase
MRAWVNLLRVQRSVRQFAIAQVCFGIFTLILLSGYAVFGKGFAYVGVPSVAYVGEIGLLLAIIALCSEIYRSLWRSSTTWLIVAFMLWGSLCTFPYVATYGLNALRDGVIWGYAIYALAVATTLLRLDAIDKVTNLYARGLRIFLIVAPIAHVIFIFANSLIPQWPWGPVDGASVLFIKSGDLAVHYAGAFPFIVFGLSSNPLGASWMALWMLGAAPLAALGRGSLLTVAASVGLVMLLRPPLKFYFAMIIGGVCIIFFYLTIMVVSPNGIDPGSSNRRILSIGQIVDNAQSIFFKSDRTDLDLEGTKRWRERWWDKIVDYTVYGDFFWTGKGFGINLADDDGFQGGIDHSLRSPHSAHMTILARSGVPGLLLWIVLQATFALKLFKNFLRDRRAKRSKLAALELWILLYWLGFMLNGSFDVFLEGPQGGIWFWSVFGFGLALIVDRQRMAKTDTHPLAGRPRRATPAVHAMHPPEQSLLM